MIAYETRRWLPADANERFYRRRRRDHAIRAGATPGTFDEVISREHLYRCFRELRQHGGLAAGVDGVRVDDLSPGEFGRIAGKLSAALQNGTYRPAPTRRQPRPKKGGGTRDLRIATVCDRAVAKALHRVLTPAYDPVFSDSSWGFRPQRSAWGMLANLLATMEAEQRSVIAVEDIRRAFDSVPLNAVLDAHKALIPHTACKEMPAEDMENLLELVAVVLRGADRRRTIGIDQGNPYSPTALNVLLHCVHDAPLDEDVVSPPRCRYADNLAYLCRGVSEGARMLEMVRDRLEPFGLMLKGEGGVYDLRAGDSALVLGFAVSQRDKRASLQLHAECWDGLRQILEMSYEAPHPEKAARESLLGWIESVGPAFVADGDRLREILTMSAEYGFREIASSRELYQRWQNSHERWQSLIQAARRRRGLS